MVKSELLFGTAGVPHSAKARSSVEGIERIKELGLDAMELEFVRGVNMGKDTARAVKKVAVENKVALSVHAPYYINLNSEDKKKTEASKKRLWDSLVVGEEAGAEIVTFHPAYLGKSSREECIQAVEKALEELLEKLEKEDMQIKLAPETTGKNSVFGSLKETLELCKRLKGVQPMIDFAHLHARCNGCLKDKKDFLELLNRVPATYLKRLRMHVSGINYSDKGERNHLNMSEADFAYKEFLKALKAKKVAGVIICESPNLEGDALLMKEEWKRIT
tara:strand:+ start:2888 stop:3715 length:828 start_codon:yes stop_codon:yes gene_type:complete